MEQLSSAGLNYAWIRKIHIRDFRGITDLNLSFVNPDNSTSRLVVLGGPNGSGKTAVLEACLIALRHPKLLNRPCEEQAIRSGADDYLIEAVLDTSSGSVRSTARNGVRQWVSEESDAARFVSPPSVQVAYFSSWRTPRLMGALPITAGKRGRRPVENEENRLWLVKQYLINAKAHESMRGSDTSYQTNLWGEPISNYRSRMNRLTKAWKSFYPHAEMSFTVEPVSDDPQAGFDVFLVRPDGTRIDLDSLSSGEIELFSFIGGIMMKDLDGGVVVIDEPELHLDPQWHVILLKSLQEIQPNCQFIIATHSTTIYDSVMSFERHFLVPDDDPRAVAWKKHDGNAQ